MIAYLDPGTGSIVLQVIVGGFAGLAVFFKMFGARLMFWKKSKPTESTDEADDAAEADDAVDSAEAQPVAAPPAGANS